MADQPPERLGSERQRVERIRRAYVERWRYGDAVPAELLHRIARDIAEHLDCSPLRAYRLARGWTIREAIDAFHAMCKLVDVKPRGLVARSWMEWEAGARPNWDYQDLVARLFQTSVIGLGWASDYSPDGRWSDRAGSRPLALLHLPRDIDDFTGRADQVRDVATLLAGPPWRSP